MKTYVTGEFETVDFADLALGRVNNLSGVSEFRVLRNRISDNFNNDDELLLYYPYLNSLFYSIYPWPAILEPYFIRASRSRDLANDKIEPTCRDDRLLEVLVSSDSAAKRISGILVNAGGHNVRTIQK